ncbi:hypothetical protein DEU56DRAFT_755418 [Suillus clintonianus]|uniref:uncharacterized protein n=1 Tax=Suillus clintonianus TaxID=1904413 RepID=UPI001B86436A|nr:uncharacterized protein DEU56DRAFT_755418 [Suillus clintonianus]KAG2140201.1 hypothetical protein DEU56DRAFT_755418 [Suillus clintonianus]
MICTVQQAGHERNWRIFQLINNLTIWLYTAVMRTRIKFYCFNHLLPHHSEGPTRRVLRAKGTPLCKVPPQIPTPPNNLNNATSLDSPSKSKVQVNKYPAPTPLQREASSKPADECVPRDVAIDLRKRIIAAIRDADNAEEVEEFFNVSKDDYHYILDAIDEDDDEDKVIRKLVYAEELKLLTATLPNRLHQAYLAPDERHTARRRGVDRHPLPIRADPHSNRHSSSQRRWPQTWSAGHVDGVQGPGHASQTKKSATRRLGGFMKDRGDLLAITSIDVKEKKKHVGPRSGSEAVEVLEEHGSVSTFSQWLSHTAPNDEDPTVMKTFRHVWQQSYHRDDNNVASPPRRQFQTCFLSAVILKKLITFFRRTLERIRDRVVSLIETRFPSAVKDAAFDRIRAWVSSGTAETIGTVSPMRLSSARGKRDTRVMLAVIKTSSSAKQKQMNFLYTIAENGFSPSPLAILSTGGLVVSVPVHYVLSGNFYDAVLVALLDKATHRFLAKSWLRRPLVLGISIKSGCTSAMPGNGIREDLLGLLGCIMKNSSGFSDDAERPVDKIRLIDYCLDGVIAPRTAAPQQLHGANTFSQGTFVMLTSRTTRPISHGQTTLQLVRSSHVHDIRYPYGTHAIRITFGTPIVHRQSHMMEWDLVLSFGSI